jgi:hypothetical protein
MVILGALRPTFRRTGVAAPRLVAAVLATMAWLDSSSSQGGELPKASNNVHASGQAAHSSQSSRTSTSESCCASSGASPGDNSDDSGGAFWWPLFAYTFLSPFWVPHALVEEGPEPSNGWTLVRGIGASS